VVDSSPLGTNLDVRTTAVYIYIYIYIYIYTHTHARTRARARVRAHTHTHRVIPGIKANIPIAGPIIASPNM